MTRILARLAGIVVVRSSPRDVSVTVVGLPGSFQKPILVIGRIAFQQRIRRNFAPVACV